MADRFPDVDWYCDGCDEYLNFQSGFDDHHQTWICAECGHANSISAGEIISEEDYDAAIDFLNNFDPKNYPL